MEDGNGSMGRDRHTSRPRPRTYQNIATLYVLERDIYECKMGDPLVLHMRYGVRTAACPMAVWADHGWWEQR